MSISVPILRVCAAALLLCTRAREIHSSVSSAGSEFVEVNSHHFSVHHPSTERPGRVMRRQTVQAADHAGQRSGVSVEVDAKSGDVLAPEAGLDNVEEQSDDSSTRDGAPPGKKKKTDLGPMRTADVKWGDYRFHYVPLTQECTEAGVSTWEGKSFFEAWSGTDTGLSTTVGTTVQKGVIKETPKGLRIYKAACPNSTTVKVGGTTTIPSGTMSVDLVFGITRRCTGDCAPFMVSVLDYHTDAVKHRWCWNREGNASEILCDETSYVPFMKWNRAVLNISAYNDFVTPIKLALEVYTSGDFRFLPTLPGEVGLGGRAMVLIDSLIFGPAERPDPDSTFKTTCYFCRQAMREVCVENSWCLDKYRCYSGWCTEGKSRCNGVRNCPDDSDEVGCEYKMGFRGELYLNHARHLHAGTGDVDSLTNPDVRLLNEQIDYDASDFWKIFHARDNFAAKWMGNFSITDGGHYYFNFDHSGDAKVRVRGIGNDNEWNLTSGAWINMPAGDYEMKISFIHLKGQPNIIMKYAGVDTRGGKRLLGRDHVSATMTGSRCDTMMCNSGDGLIAKPGSEKLLCASVPCSESVDTSTCCTRQYKVVAAGDHRTCALDMLGRPVCWGSWKGYNEQWKQHPGPFIDISTRDQYICAVLQATGMVDCWRPDNVSAPLVRYSVGGNFKNISVGGAHTCALRDSGFPACTGSKEHKEIYPPSNTEFSRLSAGQTFTCGIVANDQTVKCWGANERGQATPPTGRGHSMYTYLSAGKFHACGISNGTVHCWGENADAQATSPVGYDFAQVTSGTKHSCGLKTNGDAVCWGANADAQSSVLQDDAPFLTISAGKAHTCAIRAKDKEVVCWGSNFEVDPDVGSSTWRGQSEPPPAKIWP